MCVYMGPHASSVQAFSLVALVPAFSDCGVFICTHAQTQTCTHTPLSLQSKLGIHSLVCEREIGSIERLGGLPVLIQCVSLCVSGFVSSCLMDLHTSLTLNG